MFCYTIIDYIIVHNIDKLLTIITLLNAVQLFNLCIIIKLHVLCNIVHFIVIDRIADVIIESLRCGSGCIMPVVPPLI